MDLEHGLISLVVAVLGGALVGCTSGEGPAPTGDLAGGAPPQAATEGIMDGKGGGETVILAGGCFWGMEEILRKIPGVLGTEVGYCGGASEGATYESHAGHAESVKVVFDPAQLPLETLLRDWFFRMHDPTTLNRQGNDVGDSYRSAIFWTTEGQRAVAERVKAEVDASGFWKKPVVTEIQQAGPWSRGEEYHQDYLQKHPDGYTCHFMR